MAPAAARRRIAFRVVGQFGVLWGGQFDPQPASEELPPRPLRFSRLRGSFFFDRYQFVAELLSLPFEFRFESFLPFRVAQGPKRLVVFHLLFHHRVEDDRDLVGRRYGVARRSEFALHPPQIVAQWAFVVMQSICRHAE
jgi:hypothetical protein